MNRAFTAVVKQDEDWWIGWVQEVPGVNSQGRTRGELLTNLRSALREALEMNREEALKQAEGSYEEELILV
jgi:predicted RNase H-like HicB family nuclease